MRAMSRQGTHKYRVQAAVTACVQRWDPFACPQLLRSCTIAYSLPVQHCISTCAIRRLESRIERGNSARQIVADEEGDDANHGKAAVLQLGLALLGLLLRRKRAHETKGVPELDLGLPDASNTIKRELVDLARHTTPHVVRLLGLC